MATAIATVPTRVSPGYRPSMRTATLKSSREKRNGRTRPTKLVLIGASYEVGLVVSAAAQSAAFHNEEARSTPTQVLGNVSGSMLSPSSQSRRLYGSMP